ncbi:MAG: thioredoxin [Deltaproteobacteria bacterium]|nr:thioredoxin [Deltaproteobacteria bacterium]
MANNVVDLTDGNFEQEILKSDKPALVDFTATWCGPCKMLAPVIEQLAGQYAGKVKVGKLDIDDNKTTAQKYQIRGVPTVLVFHNGRVVDQVVGVAAKAKFDKMLERFAQS